MMLRKIVFYLLLLFCIPSGLLAIEISCSHAVFYMPSDTAKLKPYVEIYWQINPRSINYAINEDSLWVGKVITVLNIRDENGNTVIDDKYILQTTPVMPSNIFNQSIMELHRYEIPAGQYVINLSLTDVALKENTYSYSDSLDVAASGNQAFYSSVQILDTVIDSRQQSVFYRNDRQQIPLCFNFLDERKTLRYYTELYNTTKVAKEDFPLVQYIWVSKKKEGKLIDELKQIDTITPGSVLPVLGRFNLESLSSGNYYLNIELKNSNQVKLASTDAFFQLINSSPVVKVNTDTGKKELFEKVELFDVGSTFAGKFTIAQLMAILKMITPIATPVELDAINTFLRKPEETYMRYFVYNFWSARNEKDPKKPWDEYADRVREVNKLFGSGVLPGYETDRGLIWLKYGKPDERLSVQNEQGVLPYEIWKYNAPGKQSFPGVFLFYRPGFMVNDYRLLHSTVNGELRNTNWRSILYVSGSSSGDMNSRAEQYIGNK